MHHNAGLCIKNIQKNIARVVCAEERYVIVIVGDMLLINVYVPCAGTADRQFIYDEVFCNLVRSAGLSASVDLLVQINVDGMFIFTLRAS